MTRRVPLRVHWDLLFAWSALGLLWAGLWYVFGAGCCVR